MNMVMYDCGHIIRDAHVLNFLKFTVKELHHIQYVWTKIANALNHMNLKINLNLIHRSLDEKSLKHSISFIRDISERPNTCTILQRFDFELGIKSAFLVRSSRHCRLAYLS